MKKEDMLKDLIVAEFGSVLKFSEQSGIPYSTLRNIFVRGFDGIAVATALRICSVLKIDLEAFMQGSIQVRPNAQKEEAWSMHIQAVDAPKEQNQNKLMDSFSNATEAEQLEFLRNLRNAMANQK